MRSFAMQTASQATRADHAVIGRFDPTDEAEGEVLFLAGTPSLFASFEQALSQGQPAAAAASAAPFTSPGPDVAWSVAPGLTAGAILQTDRGEVAAEDLRPGQRILTRDRGFQAVLWAGRRTVTAADMQTDPALRPVLIRAGGLGGGLPMADMTVPQSQCLLVEGPRTKLMFGQREVFVPAAHLVGYPGVSLTKPDTVTSIHILCAHHEVVWANGVWGESLSLAAGVPQGLTDAQALEIQQLTARSAAKTAHAQTARRVLQRHEADLLLA